MSFFCFGKFTVIINHEMVVSICWLSNFVIACLCLSASVCLSFLLSLSSDFVFVFLTLYLLIFCTHLGDQRLDKRICFFWYPSAVLHYCFIVFQLYFVVLLRISKSCKRTDSDGFLKKSADPDADSDSGWKYYNHAFTDVWFGVRTSPHRRSRYRKLRTLTALRPHVRIRITAPCPRGTSGLISRWHAGLLRPPLAAPWHTTALRAALRACDRPVT